MYMKFLKTGSIQVVLGVIALLCMTELGGGLAIVSGISVIGLPIAIMIMAFPTLYLIFLLSKLIRWTCPVVVRTPVSLAIAIGLLAIPPWIVNSHYRQPHLDYLSSDVDRIVKPIDLSSIAVVRASGYNSATMCDGFCQRALLNGVVKTVIMVSAKQPFSALESLDTKGLAYRFEKRAVCPSPPLKSNNEAGGYDNGRADMDFE
jgi:hypothetical protein